MCCAATPALHDLIMVLPVPGPFPQSNVKAYIEQYRPDILVMGDNLPSPALKLTSSGCCLLARHGCWWAACWLGCPALLQELHVLSSW